MSDIDNDQERAIAAAMFGVCRPMQATGDHQVDPDWVRRDFEWEEGVAREFCAGCGSRYEINIRVLSEYAASLGLEPDAVAQDRSAYIKTMGCPNCDGDRSIATLEHINR